MFTFDQIAEILSHFSTAGTFVGFDPIDEGHINNTFKVEYRVGEKPIYHLLQQINTDVFKNPDELMANVDRVTAFLRDKIIADGGDPERETLYCKPADNGKKYVLDDKGKAWRLYNFVGDSFSYNSIDSPEVFFNAGKAFGRFQQQLADFPSEKLYETIPDFHNTAKRYANLMNAVKNNRSGRAKNVAEEIAFAKARRDETYILLGKTLTGDLPLRVTHNDTKLNNVLFDRATGEPVCIVDLDTVMPGLSLYDFGDAIRFGANTAAEDERDLSKVSLDLNLYEQYVRGFLTTAGDALTEEEVACMPLSAKLMTLECGMRFLTDYIDGDVYFRVAYPDHNLDRCHTQFALVADMERKFAQMEEISQRAYREIVGNRQ
ncbi:MAG: aminoglycoside phosphotransferase family protein [Clostridia bacterium]|nr:aminoglycoside phosphotransferase family protein [Clostridia bacterium]